MLPSLNTNSMQINYYFIFSRDIDDRRILQFDWTKGIAVHTQSKAVNVSDANFP